MKLPDKLKIKIEVKNADAAEKNDYLLALKINEIIDYLAEREEMSWEELSYNLPTEKEVYAKVGLTPLFKAEDVKWRIYEVKFNDYGVSHVLAHSYELASKTFMESGQGGTEVTVKSIKQLGATQTALIENTVQAREVLLRLTQ